MASLVYLRRQAKACEQLAGRAVDPNEAEDLHNLALVYQNQINILCRSPRSKGR
jgi:hypothetical protein